MSEPNGDGRALRIAMFADFHPATLGGIQTSMRAQRAALERLGHHVTVFTIPAPRSTPPDPDIVLLATTSGVTVNGYPVALPTRRNARLVDAVFAVRGFDVVHAQTTYGAGVAGLRAARRHGLPVVQSMHSRDDSFIERNSPSPYLAALTTRLLHGAFVGLREAMPRLPESRTARHAWRPLVAQAQAADQVVVPTRHFARRLAAHGVDRPIHVVSNGVDDDLVRALPERSGSRDRELRVLWCGRFSAEKRPLDAIEAVHRDAGCTLDIYGAGALEARVRAAVDRLGLRERVRLHGEVSQAECLAAMRFHDVLLFPSAGCDTQGMVLLEAVAAGIPVLHCDPDVTETVPEGGELRARDSSTDALAEALRVLVEQPDRLAAMREVLARHAGRTLQSRFTERLVAVYAEAITAASSGRLP
ncbi:glycosyltransferase [Nocardia sp. CY41]|uniref:glycosyltransferase n=1 Tax=Nocardia sp. CY41 TaxID=2608686 RepID=UPI001F389D68|nr:glycosyltransferase [Nocardia sp. CY41]